MNKIASNCSNQSGSLGLIVETKEGLSFADGQSLENKNKAICMLEKLDQPRLHTKRGGNFQSEFIQTMLTKMSCQVCERVPSPYIRYLCSNGHIVCRSCAEERFVKYGTKCMIEMQKKEDDLRLDAPTTRDSSSILPMPPILSPGYWMEDTKNGTLQLCEEDLCRYPADPVFTAIWCRAQWKCPAGCEEVFEGRELLTHVNTCSGRKTKPEASKQPSESSESDYVIESSGSEDDAPVLFCNVPKKYNHSANYGQMELKQPFRCSVAGCSQEVLMSGVVEHLILIHKVNAMNADADQRSWRATGCLVIPQSEIEARRPFYTLIRSYRRFFLFCMEPTSDNANDVGFWIRRVSNLENKEEEDGPCFMYGLVMMNIPGDTQIYYKKICTPWRKPTEEILAEKQCFRMPASYLIDQFLLNCDDEDSAGNCEDREKGCVPVNFSIMIANSVGELYSDEGSTAVTSSMESLAVVDNDIGITRDDVSDKSTEDEDEYNFFDDY